MFVYEKKLQYPVRITNPNPQLAAIIISQYGGPDGELGASLRYLSQRYSMPYPELKGLLTDIGTEELGHLEMVGTIVHQLTRTLTQEQIALVISNANFTPPFDTYLANNVAGLVYAGTYNTLFDYFNQTVADASLNTISFVLLFLFTYVVASLLVTLVNRVFSFPVLRILDGVVGGALGLARAFLLLMVLVTMIPLAVNMLQIDLITNMVEQSTLLNFFYPDNWFFGWIRSVL